MLCAKHCGYSHCRTHSQALVHLRTLTVMSGCAKCMKEDKPGEGVVCVGGDGQFYVG